MLRFIFATFVSISKVKSTYLGKLTFQSQTWLFYSQRLIIVYDVGGSSSVVSGVKM